MLSINSFPFWYHKIDINGVKTPGCHPIETNGYYLQDDLSGLRVLDIGAWDGYWTFEALKRGAKYVLAIDEFSDMPELCKDTFVEWGTFDFCKRELGYTDEQCERRTMSIYDLSPESVGMFDVVICFGVMYHLRHPMLGLDKIASVCKGLLTVESHICDNYSPYWAGGYPDPQNVLLEFYPKSELGGVSTNWFSPTMICLCKMVEAAGFKVSGARTAVYNDNIATHRGYLKAEKV